MGQGKNESSTLFLVNHKLPSLTMISSLPTTQSHHLIPTLSLSSKTYKKKGHACSEIKESINVEKEEKCLLKKNGEIKIIINK